MPVAAVRRSEARRRPAGSPIQPAPEWYGMRRPPFAVSPYPVGQPAALQGDGACVPFDSSCSPRSGSPLSNTSDLDEARPERLRVNSYAFSRGRSAQQSVPSRPVNVQDRAHSVSSRNAEVHSPSRPHAPDSEEILVSDRQLSRYLSAPELPSPWQVAEDNAGGMAAPRYLLVRLGECIPAETGAATVPRSRLDCGPQWRDFLNFADSVTAFEARCHTCCSDSFLTPAGAGQVEDVERQLSQPLYYSFQPQNTLRTHHERLDYIEAALRRLLLAFCDYSGIAYKIDAATGKIFQRWVIADGDGNEPKPFKAEWATIKDDYLWLGSIGFEWYGPSGEILHRNTEWVKVIDFNGMIRNLDWHPVYQAMYVMTCANWSE
eukprot:g15040.t1